MDLTTPGETKLERILDLIDARVEVTFEGERESTLLASPFPNDPEAMSEYLPLLMDNLTTTEETVIPGRVNINEAPQAVLLSIPGMTEEIVDQILSLRDVGDSVSSVPTDETWLLTEGIVTLEQMKELMPFVTTSGDVFRAQVVGYFDGGGVSSRAEFVVDATVPLPRVLFWRELGHLGRGFTLDALGIDMGDR